MPKIYLPETVESEMGNELTITKEEKEVPISMREVINLALGSKKNINVMDAIHGSEIYSKIKPDPKESNPLPDYIELDDELYNWLFDIVDEPFIIIFGMNAIHIKYQLFNDEPKEEIINKIKLKIKGNR